MRVRKHLVLAAFLLGYGRASAQSQEQPPEKEPAAVLELGPAAAWNFTGGGTAFGPSVAVEVTPLENRLELEIGVAPLFSHRATEWNTDLLCKKPWTLSRKVELMVGAGPEWIHGRSSGLSTNSVSMEAIVDIMFWRSAKHRIGWYVEPGYEYNFGRGREQSLGFTGGLLIAIR